MTRTSRGSRSKARALSKARARALRDGTRTLQSTNPLRRLALRPGSPSVRKGRKNPFPSRVNMRLYTVMLSARVEVAAEKPLPWYTVLGKLGTKFVCSICPKKLKWSTVEMFHAHHRSVHPGDVCYCPRGEMIIELPVVNVSEETSNTYKPELSEAVDPLQAVVASIIANDDIWQHDDNPPIDELEQQREQKRNKQQQTADVAPTGVRRKKKQKPEAIKLEPEAIKLEPEIQPEPELQPTGIPEILKPQIRAVFGESSTQKQCEQLALSKDWFGDWWYPVVDSIGVAKAFQRVRSFLTTGGLRSKLPYEDKCVLRDGMVGRPLKKEHMIAVAIENPSFERLWNEFKTKRGTASKAAESVRKIINAMKK